MAGRRLKVMISSDQEELKDLRAMLRESMAAIGHEALLFETSGAANETPTGESERLVRDCDIYVGVFDSQYSDATKTEYLLAKQMKKVRLVYVREKAPGRQPDLDSFIAQLKHERKYDTFSDATDLSRKLQIAISTLVAEELAAWRDKVRLLIRDIASEASKYMGAAKLLAASTQDRLRLGVRGGLKYQGGLFVVLDAGWDVGVREGMILEIHSERNGAEVLLGKVRVASIHPSLGPLCEVLGEDDPDFWSGVKRTASEGIIRPFPGPLFLKLEHAEVFRQPELSFQLWLEQIKEDWGI